jgi:WD40 repeat protein
MNYCTIADLSVWLVTRRPTRLACLFSILLLARMDEDVPPMTPSSFATRNNLVKSERDGFDGECLRLRQLLADQLEHDRLTEAQETVVALLCLNPNDADALGARDFIAQQRADTATHPVGEIHRLAGHQGPINAIAISPDGQLALSGGGTPSGAALFKSKIDYSVRLWELATGRELRRFKAHTSMVTAVAFSPDGKQALSAAQEGGVYVWTVADGQIVAHIGKRLPHVFAATFSAEGDKIFTASADKAVRLWDIAKGERVNRYKGHRREVTALALSPDGKQLMTGCLDGEVWLWDVRSGEVTRRAGGHTKCVYCVAFSPNAKRAISGGADLTARIWDLSTGTQEQQLVGHSYTVCGVAYSPDGQTILTAGDHTIRLWNATTGKDIKVLEGHTDSVRGVAFAPSRNRALSGSRDTTVRYWQLPGEAERAVVVKTATDKLGELPTRSVADWVKLLRRAEVLNPEWDRELAANLAAQFGSPRELLNHLVERGWLTLHQVRHLAEESEPTLRLGNYVLLRPLGAGGAGQVFKARRWGTADLVALKLVQPHQGAGPAVFKQFMSEIEALSRMNHPNIIRAYEAGMDTGRYYFTMECIDGTDLGQLVEKHGPMPVDRACKYIRQAAFGLDHAHLRRLIHRDIKPANLLLTLPTSQNSRPGLTGNWVAETALIKILDWGLAGLRRRNQAKSSDDLLDYCSIDYVAPEQALDSHAADIRSDIYSLGCTLYHLLAGKPPFHGLTGVQKLNKHQTEYPQRISILRKDVPATLESVLRKMIEKNPNERFRSPALVVAALAPFCRK